MEIPKIAAVQSLPVIGQEFTLVIKNQSERARQDIA
jgi:hypothetical protein